MRTLIFAAAVALLPTIGAAQEAVTGAAADLRVLDKLNGVVTDISLRDGESRNLGYLSIRLDECRYPAANPSGDAFAELTVTYRDQEDPVFQGWLIASAPALNAMEHPRYDVWVLRCKTS